MKFDTKTTYYHGTNASFEKFEERKSLREGFLGATFQVKCEVFFFTENKEIANVFAQNREETFGGKANVKECFLSFNNQLDLTGGFKHDIYENTENGIYDKESKSFISTKPTTDEILTLLNEEASYNKLCKILSKDLIKEDCADYEMVDVGKGPLRKKYSYSQRHLLLLLDEGSVVKSIKEHGYDSVLCDEGKFDGIELGKSIAVLSPEQIIDVDKYKQENKAKRRFKMK